MFAKALAEQLNRLGVGGHTEADAWWAQPNHLATALRFQGTTIWICTSARGGSGQLCPHGVPRDADAVDPIR